MDEREKEREREKGRERMKREESVRWSARGKVPRGHELARSRAGPNIRSS